MTTQISNGVQHLSGGVSPVRTTEVNHVFRGPVYGGRQGERLVVVGAENYAGEPIQAIHEGQIVMDAGIGDSASVTSAYRVVAVSDAYRATVADFAHQGDERWYRTAKIELIHTTPSGVDISLREPAIII